MLASHAYYAFKVNLLFSNYAPKYLVHKQNISFSIVLKHGGNRNNLLSSRDDCCWWLKEFCKCENTHFVATEAELVK